MTRFGIEEEAMLVHSETLEPLPLAAPVLTALGASPGLRASVTREYLSSQVEYSSPILDSAQQAHDALRQYRRALATSAERAGAVVWHAGVPFTIQGPPHVTPTDRYELLAGEYRELVREHQINAVHVHVEIPSKERGVQVLNAVRGWMPVLLALSSNSPYWRGRDSGFESWRSIQMRRWTTHDCPPSFRDADDDETRTRRLVGIGGTIDVATVAWNVRLSHHHPTIEFRVFDAQLEPSTTVLLALICRALVAAVSEEEPAVELPPELLEASLWQAARDGIASQLFAPLSGALTPASAVIADLLALIEDAAEAHGDSAEIRDGVARLVRDGTGATQQRLAYQRGGTQRLGQLHSSSFPAA